jgi:predicted Na+-dependent transporter
VKSAGCGRDNPKADVVVVVVGIVVVPVSRATVLREVVPGTAAQSLDCLPQFSVAALVSLWLR